MSIQLGQIVEILGGKLHGDAAREIKGLASLQAADSNQISFVSNQKYEQQLGSSKAACVIVGPVSYTHLRAHETPEHLVCRLLLEKKKLTQSNNS